MARKRQKQKRYSAEFKLGVIMDMREHHLGYRETVRRHWKLKEYIRYYNNDRISTKLKGMSPVQYRTHSQSI